jgi:transposase
MAGATLLFLPPYSPDFNPIEQAFAKLEALLRKARTLAALENAIAEALDAVTPPECANYFANSGYQPD